VLVRGQERHGGRLPAGMVLTHPEDWTPTQVQVLLEASASIGYPPDRVRTVSEPRAAAQYYSRATRLDPGARVAVFDFGGGTLDVAVLSASGDGSFDVISAGGDNNLGGRDFDAIIKKWLASQLDQHNRTLLEALNTVASPRELRTLDGSIRSAKEILSESPQAGIEVAVGDERTVLLLTRREFEDMVGQYVARCVELTASVVEKAGGAVDDIYLTGGSSRIPLVHRKIQSLGRVATLDDPKTVVAQGALIAATRRLTRSGRSKQAAPSRSNVEGRHGELEQQHAVVSTAVAPGVVDALASKAGGKRVVLGALAVAAVVVAAGIGAGVALTGKGSSESSPIAASASPQAGGGPIGATTTTTADSGETYQSIPVLTTPSPTDVSALEALLPKDLTTDCESPTISDDSMVDVSCSVRPDLPETVGLSDGGMMVLTASTVFDPAWWASDLRHDMYRDVKSGTASVIEDDPGKIEEYDANMKYLMYFNPATKLALTVGNFPDEVDCRQFLARTGL
jgi:hypothetical protein